MNAQTRTIAFGAAFMLVPGAVYAFSEFVQPLSIAFDWSPISVTTAFGISLFFLGLAAAAGGFLVDRFGPRLVALTGVALVAFANILVALGTPSLGLWWFYLTFGVLGGTGAGLAYITGTATIMRTQTRRFGFGAGIAALGFGLGALVYDVILHATSQFQSVSAATAAIKNAQDYAAKNGLDLPASASVLAPAEVHNLMTIFMVSGVEIAFYGFLFAMLLHAPEKREASVEDRSVKSVVLSMQWWFIWLSYFIATVAGGGIIANAVAILHDVTSLTVAELAPWITALAVCACVGRLTIGLAVDHVGYRRMTSVLLVLQAGLYFALASIHALVPALVIFGAASFCAGGFTSVLGGWTAQSFGTRHYGAIWGLLVVGFGSAGLVGPWFVSKVGEVTGSYSGALMPMGLMLAVCALLPAMMHERGTAAPRRELHSVEAA